MKIKKETTLKVSPLLNYKVPTYPSYDDNITYDDTYNGIFSLKQTSILFATALAAMTYLPVQAGDGVDKSFKNPFAVSKSGLPHRFSMFGTGAPSRLDDETAKKFIKQIFKEEGIKLEDNVKYDKSGIEFIASSYNKKMNIGFIYGSYKTLDPMDAFIDWSTNYEKMTEQAAIKLIGNKFTKQIQTAFKISGDTKRGVALKKIHKESTKEVSKKLISIEEAKKLEKNASQNKNFVAFISQFDNRLTFRFSHNPKKDFKKIFEAKSKEDRMKLYKEFQNDITKKVAAKKVMDLEENVRKYINWAKSHGL